MSRAFGTPGSGDRCVTSSAPISAFPFSAFCWARPDSQTDAVDGRTLTCHAVSTTPNQFYSIGIDTTGAGLIYARNTTLIAGLTTRLCDGAAWNAIGGKWTNATSRTAYLARLSDTTLDTGTSTSSVTFAAGAHRISIGHLGDSTPNQECGSAVAHVAWWSVGLTDAEWEMLLLGRVSPLAVRPQSLVFYAPYLGRDSPEIDIIGGRTLTLTGTSSSAEEPPMLWRTGRRKIFLSVATAPAPGVDAPVQTPAGKPRPRRYFLEIDGQTFEVSSPAHAQAVLDRARELAQAHAEKLAQQVVPKKRKTGKRPVSLQTPQISSPDPELKEIVQQARQSINAIYRRAAIDAELALLLLQRMAEEDEEDALLLLM